MEVTPNIRTLTAAMLLALPAALFAQDGPLRGNVVVDGKYLPDVIRQDKINTLPRIYSFPMKSTTLPYEKKGVSTPFSPGLLPMPVTGWNTTREVRSYDGYVNLWCGSWLNTALSAGYRILRDENNQLGVWLQHNSTSLMRPHMSEGSDHVRRKRYDEAMGMDYTHIFPQTGRLSFNLDYHLGYFNYYGCFDGGVPDAVAEHAPTQTLNDVAARVKWQSPSQAELQYDAALKLRYFGFRSLYEPAMPLAYLSSEPNVAQLRSTFKGEKETHISLDGGVLQPLDDSSSLSVRATADALTYAKPLWRENRIDNYGDLRLRPGYRFQRGNLDIDLGAKFDFTFGAGPEHDRFDLFYIAPDIKLDFKSGVAGIFLHIGGGTQLNTLAGQYARDYYTLPALLSTTPAYSPFDARLGASFGPFSGLTATMTFAYKYVRHQPLGGLYTWWLNHPATPVPDNDRATYSPLSTSAMNIKGWSLSTRVDYRLSDMVQIAVDGAYQPQKGEKGYFNGLDRPRWTLSASATVRPMSKLQVEAAYNYRGLRRVYCPTTEPYGVPGLIVNGSDVKRDIKPLHLPDITDVSLRAAYDITPAMTVSLQADNLLNRKILLLPDVRSQGAEILGGIQFTF